jgi:hypothetical protein
MAENVGAKVAAVLPLRGRAGYRDSPFEWSAFPIMGAIEPAPAQHAAAA